MQQAPVLDPAPSAPSSPGSEPDEPALPDEPPLPDAPPVSSSLRCVAVAAAPALCLDGAFATLLARADAPAWAYGLLVGLTGVAVYAVVRPRRASPPPPERASRHHRREA